MKKGLTFKENIEFLIMMYQMELDQAEKGKQKISVELEDAYKNIIIELETIIKLSK